MTIFISILAAICFSILIAKLPFFKLKGLDQKMINVAFGLKLMASVFLLFLYSFYYVDREEADIFKYFDDGQIMHSSYEVNSGLYWQMLLGNETEIEECEVYYGQMNNWYRYHHDEVPNDNRIVIRANAFLMLFTNGNYYLHLLIWTCLAFIGQVLLYKSFAEFIKRKALLFGILFLLPSTLLWTSGVLKEPIVLLGLGLLFWGIVNLKHRKIYFFPLLLGIGLLLQVKLYILFALILPVIAYFINSRVKRPNLIYGGSLLLGILILPFSTALIGVNVLDSLKQKQADFIQLGRGGIRSVHDADYFRIEDGERERIIVDGDQLTIPAGVPFYKRVKGNSNWKEYRLTEAIQTEITFNKRRSGSMSDFLIEMDGSLVSFLMASSVGVLNSVFQPYPWEVNSPLMFLPFLENVFILYLLVMAIKNWRNRSIDRRNEKYLFFLFSILLLAIVGACTPVIGALVRYKVPALPFLLVWCLLMLENKKLVQNRWTNKLRLWIEEK